MIKLFVKDKCGGYVHEIGTSTHDSLVLEDGCLQYYNLQNGEGTLGDYEFVNEDGSAIEDEYLRFAWIGVDEPTNKCLQCDQTEEINDLTNRLLITKSEKQDLEKALDKVCELLEDCPLTALDKELDCNNCTDDYAKCWKVWALKDE